MKRLSRQRQFPHSISLQFGPGRRFFLWWCCGCFATNSLIISNNRRPFTVKLPRLHHKTKLSSQSSMILLCSRFNESGERKSFFMQETFLLSQKESELSIEHNFPFSSMSRQNSSSLTLIQFSSPENCWKSKIFLVMEETSEKLSTASLKHLNRRKTQSMHSKQKTSAKALGNWIFRSLIVDFFNQISSRVHGKRCIPLSVSCFVLQSIFDMAKILESTSQIKLIFALMEWKSLLIRYSLPLHQLVCVRINLPFNPLHWSFGLCFNHVAL